MKQNSIATTIIHYLDAIYTRKSSEQEDRQMLSTESQIKEMSATREKEVKINRNAKLILTFEEAKSAKTPYQRDLFEQLIKHIEDGKINRIFVWHPDRLSRNSIDVGRLIYLMDMGKLIEIITPGQAFRNTPNDKFLLSLLCSQAKLENDNKSINVKRGLKTKAENGWLPNGAKPGYMNDKYADKGSKTIKNDPERFPLIKKAWDTMLTGLYSPPQVLRILNNEWGYRTPIHKKLGGKPMSRSMIYKVFTDPFYYGEYEFPTGSNIWHQGKHEPMITREEFDRVQALLGGKGRPRPKAYEFSYLGLLHCGECGGSITAEEKWQIICPTCKTKFASRNKETCPNCNQSIEEMTDPKILHYVYYHCTKKKNPNCTQGSIELKKLEEEIETVLSNIQISERFKNWAIKYLNEMNDKAETEHTAILQSLQKAYENINTQMNNLIRLKISPNNTSGELITEEQFIEQKTIILKEKSTIEEKLKDFGSSTEKWMDFAVDAFNFACHAREHFANGDIQTKTKILGFLGSNLKLIYKKLDINLIEPLQYIETMKQQEPTISASFEPEINGLIITKLEDYWTQNPSLLPD